MLLLGYFCAMHSLSSCVGRGAVMSDEPKRAKCVLCGDVTKWVSNGRPTLHESCREKVAILTKPTSGEWTDGKLTYRLENWHVKCVELESALSTAQEEIARLRLQLRNAIPYRPGPCVYPGESECYETNPCLQCRYSYTIKLGSGGSDEP